jgi:4-nitrophenyl phosphatase
MTTLPPNIRGLILDMDGVLWKAEEPIGDLGKIFADIRARGLNVVMATNNSTKTPAQYVERLRGFGAKVYDWQVVTSSQAAAALMKKQLPENADVFAIGEDGLIESLRAQGFNPLNVQDASRARAVVMGIDREINFEKIREATLLVRAGIPFYATNPDKTFPTPRGEIPGAGAWQAVIVTASGIEPIVAGKPAPHLLELALERLGTDRAETLVVGDRLETDIAGGQGIGCPTALVLSGIATRSEGEAWMPKVDIISESLQALVAQP